MKLLSKSELLPVLIASLVTLALFLTMTLLGGSASAQGTPASKTTCSTIDLFGANIDPGNSVSVTIKEYNTTTCGAPSLHSIKLNRKPAWSSGVVPRECDVSNVVFKYVVDPSKGSGWKADQDDPGYATYTALPCSVSLSSRTMYDYGPFEANVEYSYNIGVVYEDNPNETYWYRSPGTGTSIGVGIVRRSHGVWISPTNLTIDEGGASKFYEVRLNTAPSSNVTVRMAEDGDVTLSHSSLTFTSVQLGKKANGNR